MRITNVAAACLVALAACASPMSTAGDDEPLPDGGGDDGDDGPAPSGDFTDRCAAPGVVRCIGFEQPTEIAGTYGDISGILAGATTPQLDTSQKASGESSLLFTIPTTAGSDTSGSYFTNFSDDLALQFDGGDELFVQWRQRFSPQLLETYYAEGGGWKQSIIGAGDVPGCTASTSAGGQCASSCTTLELVTQNYYQQGFPIMYNSCTGSASHGPYDPFFEPFGDDDFKLQNARPAPYCLYSQRDGYFAPQGGCFGYVPDEWMTFQVGVTLGPRQGDEFVGSRVRMWIAREGQPSELAIDWGPYNLSAGTDGERYGKVWLTPYHTGKSPSASYPEAYTWYDELIVSRQRIGDPR